LWKWAARRLESSDDFAELAKILMFDLIIMEKAKIENGSRDGGYIYTRLHHKPPL
jgi:hypothetical protein